MKEQTIKENEAGQRLDKYLAKLLREAPKSFFTKCCEKEYHAQRQKALGNELLCQGDVVRLFLSDETFEKFKGQEAARRIGS